MNTQIAHIESMLAKAAEADRSDEAMRFSQAAVNAANALSQIGYIRTTFGEKPEKFDIDAMVSRFLGWKLPENFSPDNGISFEAAYTSPTGFTGGRRYPVGTNLFTATQAKEMIRHILGED